MRLTSILAAILCTAFASAQTPAPGQIDPAYTIKTGAQLVVLDVVVKDKGGHPVHNLGKSDFTVKENGKPQDIRDFEEHSTLSREQLAAIPARPNLPPGEFTNYVATAQTTALNILLYDANNTSVKDQAYMRQQLIAYLKHARPDSRTAIFALTTRLVMLQGFTSDPAALLAALDARGTLQQSLLRDNTSGGLQLAPTSTSFGNIVSQDAEAFGASKFAVNFLDTSAAINQSYQDQVRAFTTLDGLNDLARMLVTLPGRKNLIWFAGDFPPDFFPSENSVDGPYALTSAIDTEYRDTVNLLTRAQVAVYPIGSQALQTDQDNNASTQNAPSRITLASNSMSTMAPSTGTVETKNQQQHADEFNLRSSEEQAMQQIARDTGGKAFYNHNDLTRMVSDAISDGSEFYTLSYIPTADMSKDGLRSIAVALAGKGYELSYRRGYYADRSRKITAANVRAAAPPSALAQALQPGSPQPTQILLRTRATFASGPDRPAIVPGNQPNPDPKRIRAPYINVSIDTAASILEMSFAHADDNLFHTDIDFVTDLYDYTGTLINSQSNTVRASYTREKLAQAMRSGIHFNQQISVPTKGDYFLRIAVHDNSSGHIGAVEIPLSEIPYTPPATASR
jgi:VWFA-related protein